MYSWYVNEDQEPLSNQPILFYTKKQEFTGSTAIQFQNDENLTSNIAPSNVKQDLTQTINYGSEIDEYTLEVNNNSLFNNFYRKFILGAFSPRSKILSVNAVLDADFILNYKLSDTIVINNRKFHINTLDVNGGTGQAKLELRNIFDISDVPNTDNPTVNELTISSPAQSENDASGTYTFTVFSNVSWTVSESSDFISVSPVSGSNNARLTITYDENTTTDTRAGVVTVTGGGFVREHTLTQTGKAITLSIDPQNKTVAKESGDYDFDITSNSAWTIAIDQPWVYPNTFNGSGNATINIEYEANLATDSRQANLVITAGNLTETHTTTQLPQASSQLYAQSMTTGNTKTEACNSFNFQTYYTDNAAFINTQEIFYDAYGINRVPQGFFRKETFVLQTDANGQVIDNTQTCS
jgi:hypothetical protein